MTQETNPCDLLVMADLLMTLDAKGTVLHDSAIAVIDRTIADLALRRNLIGIGEDMVNAAYDSPVDFAPREQIEGNAAKGANYLLEVDNPLVVPTGGIGLP